MVSSLFSMGHFQNAYDDDADVGVSTTLPAYMNDIVECKPSMISIDKIDRKSKCKSNHYAIG